jgi:asparagine synthase (glutamine-hydrolysing)
VTPVASRAIRDVPWLVQFPAERFGETETGLPVLWTASARDVYASFSGALFEPDLLAKRVGLPGDALRNPAAIVLETYLQRGDRWLHDLRGRYAVIIDDRRRHRFFAARDVMGLHPLFFAQAQGKLLLSWSTEALVSHPAVSREVNRVALAEHLVHRWSDASETYYEAVRRVPPGHVVEVDQQGLRLRRYWDPSQGGVQWLSGEEVEQFEEVFDRAVTRCLQRGRAGIFLSGGFDSVSIAAVAVDNAPKLGVPLPRALSLGFQDPSCDEQMVQRRVAQSLGMTQDLVLFNEAAGERGLVWNAMEMASTWPAPLMNLWMPVYTYLARRGRDNGCTTILTGSGGDEWLTASPYLAADYMRQGRVADLVRQMTSLRRFYHLSTFDAIRNTFWTFGGRPIASMLAGRMAPAYWSNRRHRNVVASTPAWVAPDPELRKRIDERASQVLAPTEPENGSFYERELRISLDHPLVALEAEEYFEMGRRLGVDIVHPYWDSDLVDLLYRTPPQLLSRNGQSKSLVRETVARRFPKLGFERKKKMRATEFYWKIMRTEGRRAWEAMGQASALADIGVVDGTLLSSTLAQLFDGRRPRESYRIWNTLHLEAWTRPRVQIRSKETA